ncbi:MAG: PIN domain-containing protein [candidate division KSB1 bacterium]|nr:PIN domain-containing protein [candidate division KSB1 bacterium]
MLLLLDANIFIIDRFFPQDPNYDENKTFIRNLERQEGYLSIFTLLELCGIASFNLSKRELSRWLYQFSEIYPIKILEPEIDEYIPGRTLYERFLEAIHTEIESKMTLGDALIMKEAKEHNIQTLVTWNKRHFIHQTGLTVLTPVEFNQMLR